MSANGSRPSREGRGGNQNDGKKFHRHVRTAASDSMHATLGLPPAAPQCTDCTATAAADTGHLDHDTSCPIGVQLDRMSEDDRLWFEQHPRQAERRRPVREVETVQLVRALGITIPPDAALTWHGQVVVRQIAPGVRVRSYGNVFAVLQQGGAS